LTGGWPVDALLASLDEAPPLALDAELTEVDPPPVAPEDVSCSGDAQPASSSAMASSAAAAFLCCDMRVLLADSVVEGG
jgi:hypothetical protein